MKLVVATHNAGKLREISQMLPEWDVAGEDSAAEETESTFSGNARIKARSVALRNKGVWVLADDSGLEVEALDFAPGVRSARYAGRDGDTKANNALLLENLKGVENRRARFVCAMVLVSPGGEEHLFEGVCNGRIIDRQLGTEGFGYDPLFIPDGFDKTFAELDSSVKNTVSHRAKALSAAKDFIVRSI
jgi:XTP/dITP diphosphohydrolase